MPFLSYSKILLPTLDASAALIDDGILDSFDVVSIISELDDAFDVQIRITELDPENFNSAESIWNLVQELKK